MSSLRRTTVAVAIAVSLAACGDDMVQSAPPAAPDAGAGGDALTGQDPAVGRGPAGDPLAGTQFAAISPREAQGFAEPAPVVVEGLLYGDGEQWRLCGELAESYPPQCPGGHLVVTNPEAIGEEVRAGLTSAQGISWRDRGVTFAGVRRGAEGFEVDHAVTGANPDGLVGGDAVDPGAVDPDVADPDVADPDVADPDVADPDTGPASAP
jgi:hypothetical protein